jgi:hypothetical protein
MGLFPMLKPVLLNGMEPPTFTGLQWRTALFSCTSCTPGFTLVAPPASVVRGTTRFTARASEADGLVASHSPPFLWFRLLVDCQGSLHPSVGLIGP